MGHTASVAVRMCFFRSAALDWILDWMSSQAKNISNKKIHGAYLDGLETL
jgi:hypothetical protein